MDQEKLEQLKKALDKQVGDETQQILLDLIEEIRKVNFLTPEEKQQELKDLYDKVSQLTETKTDKLIDAVEELTNITEKIKLEFPEKFKVEVENQLEYPTEIKVSNLKDPLPYPTEIALKKPTWLEQITRKDLSSAVDAVTKAVEGTKINLEPYREPKNALAVRLVDRKGQTFYDAVAAISGGGGGASFPYETATSVAKAGLVDAQGHVQVDILSMVPGAGAINLGKAEDAVHASGDIGVMALGVRKDVVESLASAEGDYTPFLMGEHGGLHTEPQHITRLNDFGATTGWTVLGNDTVNLATTTNHVCLSLALEFDKVDGAANTTIAGIQKTITAIEICKFLESAGFALMPFYISSTADVDYVFLRLGTDSSNYNEYQVNNDDDIFIAGWNLARLGLSIPTSVVGNGIDTSNITYLAVGVSFDAQDDTLEDIAFDNIHLNSGLQTSSDITAQISSSVSSPNVIVRQWGNAVDTGAGNEGNNTLRVVNATDDPNLAPRSTLVAFVTDVPNAGTRVQLVSNTVIAGVLEAPSTNSGNVFIGGSTVSSTVFGSELQPGQSVGVAIDNTNKIYIDAASDGDDVAFFGS